jgi:hypothetical protein
MHASWAQKCPATPCIGLHTVAHPFAGPPCREHMGTPGNNHSRLILGCSSSLMRRNYRAPACSALTRTPSQSESWSALACSVTPPPLVRKQVGYRGSWPGPPHRQLRVGVCRALAAAASSSEQEGVTWLTVLCVQSPQRAPCRRQDLPAAHEDAIDVERECDGWQLRGCSPGEEGVCPSADVFPTKLVGGKHGSLRKHAVLRSNAQRCCAHVLLTWSLSPPPLALCWISNGQRRLVT